MAAALEGITALDLTQGVAGPYCSKLLACLGADVIKVEPPVSGDSSRHLGPFVNDDPDLEKSLPFLYLNTGKKSITLDIETQMGGTIFRDLAKEADIVLESFQAGHMRHHGLHYDRLAEDNPRLVMTSVTFFGQDGPYSGYKGEEIIGQALSGNMQITGEPDREPVKMGSHFAQYCGGQVAFTSSLMALYYSLTTGLCQQVDCAIVEANTDLLDGWGVNAVLGRKQNRTGMRHHGGYPAQIYPCRDGYVVLGTEPAGWDAFVDLVGDEALRNPDFAGTNRRNYREEIDSILVSWLQNREKTDVYQAAQAKRIASGYLMTAEDMLESPQLQARDYFQQMNHPIAGTARYPGPPFRLSKTEWRWTPAPLLGEHNQEVYGQRLGFSAQDLALLKQQDVI